MTLEEGMPVKIRRNANSLQVTVPLSYGFKAGEWVMWKKKKIVPVKFTEK